MAPIQLTNPIIALGSLILVTGVNGLIASHIADQLLAAGYRVRGTVRDLVKSSWVTPLFESRHGPGNFELIQVADLAEPGVWPAALKGVAGIITVAASADLTSTKPVDDNVKEEVEGFYALLDVANKTHTVKSVVYTSSVWAAWNPVPNIHRVVTEKTYNDHAVQVAADPAIPQAEKGIAPFMAAKVKVEQALWDWVAREKPSFRFNSILPGTVIGPILEPDKQPASTAGFVRGLWNSDPRSLAIIKHITPLWFVDARDNARLYLAALTTPGVEGERLFGCAERFSFPQVSKLLREAYPGKDVPELEDDGWDGTELATERPLELLRSVGQDEWTGLLQSLKDTVESFEGKTSS
ncbi:hypothetical protein GE09DRAFT_1212514 [Coniochaeta sp. 2T2.1]|nr:hypothetical protein GE09DRAFT_1212514 [Coniochaeta sp. 2T2.1]